MMVLNFADIAKVCQTDVRSIEAVYNEIIEQMMDAIKQGISLRLSLKVGRLEVRNGEISWKQYSDHLDRSLNPLLADAKTGTSTKNNSRYTRMSRSRQSRVSVVTPSWTNLRSRSFH